ncbi:Anaphase-promoting complex (APC), subunit 11 [Handroanthus impetiginosus]|uniref:Anaphase-promoting complex (APC), subunit 11 n=1 Tax=Handroanthus impetiginosus TaxID=429701 RepID=A0A2G9GV31_9LAMI|nr:Anaphase-promoting complex (APC), subunit 11 [Handroanthus impetiginosus]
MSTTTPPAAGNAVSLGYGIAVAASVLVLISTVVLASYICIRIKANRGREEERDNNLTRQHQQFQEPTRIVFGLEKPVIETFPMIELGQSKRWFNGVNNNDSCSICLSDYCVKDKLRCIPECNHWFHARCIDEWLQVNGSCPLCRNSPISTPLSEVVPLAYYTR